MCRFRIAGWFLCALALGASADIRVNAVFTDGMILQRDDLIPVWGTAAPGESVHVSIANKQAGTVSGSNGFWRALVGPVGAGGPHELVIRGRTTVRFADVLVGEVWLCSGQSNMARGDPPPRSLPLVRYSIDSRAPRLKIVAGSGTVPTTAMYFASALYDHLRVPVGIIIAAKDATFSMQWMSRSALSASPALEKYARDYLANFSSYGIGGEFSAKIKPLAGYAIRGVIWWQGEKEAMYFPGKKPLPLYDYTAVFAALVKDWRDAWGQADLPFITVQLPSVTSASAQEDFTWGYVRDAQRRALSVAHSAMVVSIDLNQGKNALHPGASVKDSIGSRLARSSRAIAYGASIVHTGPLCRKATREGSSVRVSFDNAGSGLTSHGETPRDFSIAGIDSLFVAATARIDGETVVVQSPKVSDPSTVRFGWRRSSMCNLFSRGSGLAASPFGISVSGSTASKSPGVSMARRRGPDRTSRIVDLAGKRRNTTGPEVARWWLIKGIPFLSIHRSELSVNFSCETHFGSPGNRGFWRDR